MRDNWGWFGIGEERRWAKAKLGAEPARKDPHLWDYGLTDDQMGRYMVACQIWLTFHELTHQAKPDGLIDRYRLWHLRRLARRVLPSTLAFVAEVTEFA